jgi:hypothetical protein
VAKLVDPDSLNQGTEVVISTGAKTIQLLVAGNLSDASPGATSGVTLQALYSFLKEEWKSDTNLNKFKFPIQMFTKTDGQFINSWAFADAQSRQLVRDAGWTEGSNIYAGIISLGSFDDDADQAYYTQATPYNSTVSNFDKTGNLNEAVDITSLTSYIKSFLRIQGKTFSEYRLVEEQGLASLEPVLYRQPLANATDIGITESDANIGSNSPYTGMGLNYLAGELFETAAATTYAIGDVVQDGTGRWAYCTGAGTVTTPGGGYSSFGGTSTWEAYSGERQIGANYYAFNRILEANGGTAAEVYNWMQYALRQSGDINDDDSTPAGQRSGLVMNGQLAELLGFFVGDNLHTEGGVFIDNFDVNSTNSLTFGDITVDGGGLDATTHLPVTSTDRVYPFVAAGTLEFSSNLVAETDSDTIYTMYFTTNPGGDFDTSSAIIVNDNSSSPITGEITGASIAFDFDYDNNVQGGRTAATDASVTVVAQGLSGAQWVSATATITRTTGISIPVNANDERNYANPV